MSLRKEISQIISEKLKKQFNIDYESKEESLDFIKSIVGPAAISVAMVDLLCDIVEELRDKVEQLETDLMGQAPSKLCLGGENLFP